MTIPVLPDVIESRQGIPGILNGYDWKENGKQDGIIDHVNAGAGQFPGETKPQVYDATQSTLKPNGEPGVNEKWTSDRNAGAPNNGQTTTAVPGEANLTYVPFSTNSTPVVQMQIDFNILNEYFGRR